MEDWFVSVRSEFLRPKTAPVVANENKGVQGKEEAKTKETEAFAANIEENLRQEGSGKLEEDAGRGEGEGEGVKGTKRKVDLTGTTKLSLKKRHQKTHIEKGKRLCTFILKGESCPYADNCQYSHDIIQYLAEKEPDLDCVCYSFLKYGYCNSGFACRYGDCHIDRLKGENIRKVNETLP